MFLTLRAFTFFRNPKIQKSTLRATIFFSAVTVPTELNLTAFNSYKQGLSMVIVSNFSVDPPGRMYWRVPWIVSYVC